MAINSYHSSSKFPWKFCVSAYIFIFAYFEMNPTCILRKINVFRLFIATCISVVQNCNGYLCGHSILV